MARSHPRCSAVAWQQPPSIACIKSGAAAASDAQRGTSCKFLTGTAGTRPLCRDRPRERRAVETWSAQNRGTSRSARNDAGRGASGADSIYSHVKGCRAPLCAYHHRAGTGPEWTGGAQERGSALARRTWIAAASARYGGGAAAPWRCRRRLYPVAPVPVKQNEGLCFPR
jgi:hypothetical protein